MNIPIFVSEHGHGRRGPQVGHQHVGSCSRLVLLVGRRVGRCPDGRDVRSFVVYNTIAQAEEERKQQRRRVLEGLEENMEHFYNIRGMSVQKDSEEVVIFKELADNSARERYQHRGAEN